MTRKSTIIFIISLIIVSCDDIAYHREQKQVIKKNIYGSVFHDGKYVNGKFNGVIVKMNALGDTLSKESYELGVLNGESYYFEKNQMVKEVLFIKGQMARSSLYSPSGKLKRVSSYVLGTNTINAFIQYDQNNNIIKENSNVILKKKGDDMLIIQFYEPYPNEIEFNFKNNFKDTKSIDHFKVAPFNKKEILIKLKDSYYFKGGLNLILTKIWESGDYIRMKHETKIQLTEDEVPDLYNIDPIDYVR